MVEVNIKKSNIKYLEKDEVLSQFMYVMYLVPQPNFSSQGFMRERK
jgi:hypothetical protein